MQAIKDKKFRVLRVMEGCGNVDRFLDRSSRKRTMNTKSAVRMNELSVVKAKGKNGLLLVLCTTVEKRKYTYIRRDIKF